MPNKVYENEMIEYDLFEYGADLFISIGESVSAKMLKQHPRAGKSNTETMSGDARVILMIDNGKITGIELLFEKTNREMKILRRLSEILDG